MSLAGINAASSDALRAQLPARHELKFYINPGDYLILRGLLDKVLRRDVHGDANNNYSIRSLYFDDAYNAAYLQKLDGVEVRDKYRIRIYKCSDKEIFLERKRKQGELIQKSSVRITRRLCDQIISGDPTGMERAENELVQDMYRQMRTRLMRPVVIVDYVREAYCHPVENVRITFDKQLRTGLFSRDLFNPDLPTVSPLDGQEMILEVKYDRFLPQYIRDILENVPGNRCAISKYVLCRRFEPIEWLQ